MRTSVRIAACVAPLLAVAAHATADGLLSLDEWTELTDGKTVHYSVDGQDAGREYYPTGGGFAVFVAPDGSCVEGPWAHTDGRFCFWYGADFQCFYHRRKGEELVSEPDSGGQVQIITDIKDNEPLFCAPG